MSGAYEAAYDAWRRDPETFWAQAAESIHWYRRWDLVLDASRAPFYGWFSGGLVNTC
jgi:propionyl-CoA synthetase